MQTLDKALAAVKPYMREQIIPATQVINPLLDVWAAAQSIHPSVAGPVEGLLTKLACRSMATPSELLAALDEVRLAAVQVNVLANALM
jgi:hypothetical protein